MKRLEGPERAPKLRPHLRVSERCVGHRTRHPTRLRALKGDAQRDSLCHRCFAHTRFAHQTGVVFLPPFLLVLVLSPLVPKMRTSPWWSAALDGVNAASMGIMALVTVRLGVEAVVDPFTAVLMALGLFAVLRLKVNAAWVVLAGALLGLMQVLL